MHPATEAILKYFAFEHLPLALQNVSRPFAELAHELTDYLDGPELTVCLRKLLEAKDCAVRAALPAPSAGDSPVKAMRARVNAGEQPPIGHVERS